MNPISTISYIYTVYLEPICPLFLGLNLSKEGLFQSKQGSFGFQVYIDIDHIGFRCPDPKSTSVS